MTVIPMMKTKWISLNLLEESFHLEMELIGFSMGMMIRRWSLLKFILLKIFGMRMILLGWNLQKSLERFRVSVSLVSTKKIVLRLTKMTVLSPVIVANDSDYGYHTSIWIDSTLKEW